ncbi:hypothetical protein BCAR13_780022 [Paraburkholderia caribensis]|nr:hypothetical protein BCAR13_780022 [Paraburkholderia caribensis]
MLVPSHRCGARSHGLVPQWSNHLATVTRSASQLRRGHLSMPRAIQRGLFAIPPATLVQFCCA